MNHRYLEDLSSVAKSASNDLTSTPCMKTDQYGNLKYCIQVNLSDYPKDNIKISTSGYSVTIHAFYRENKIPGELKTHEFKRVLTMPANAIMSTLNITRNNEGIVFLEIDLNRLGCRNSWDDLSNVRSSFIVHRNPLYGNLLQARKSTDVHHHNQPSRIITAQQQKQQNMRCNNVNPLHINVNTVNGNPIMDNIDANQIRKLNRRVHFMNNRHNESNFTFNTNLTNSHNSISVCLPPLINNNRDTTPMFRDKSRIYTYSTPIEPNIKTEDLSVQTINGVLTVTTKRENRQHGIEHRKYTRRNNSTESFVYHYSMEHTLPTNVDQKHLQIRIENGMLICEAPFI